MPFPQIAASSSGNSGANVTDHVIGLPAGIAAGDMLVAELNLNGSEVGAWPAGWTELYAQGNGPFQRQEVRYRIADGSEGATITVTTASATASAHISRRITGHNSAIEAATPATSGAGSSANPDPPAFTPSWGAADTLWIALCNYRSFGGGNSITAYPASYTLSQLDDDFGTAGAYGVGGGSAARELNAATDDPGAFTISASELWIAGTIAIQPGGGGGGGASGAASISGGGSITADGTKTAGGTASISGGGGVTAAGTKGASGAASVTGGGGVNATGTASQQEQHSGAASVTGGGSVSATGTKGARGSAAATGGGAVVATGTKSALGAVVIIGGGGVTAAGRKLARGTALITGGGSVTAIGFGPGGPPVPLEIVSRSLRFTRTAKRPLEFARTAERELRFSRTVSRTVEI